MLSSDLKRNLSLTLASSSDRKLVFFSFQTSMQIYSRSCRSLCLLVLALGVLEPNKSTHTHTHTLKADFGDWESELRVCCDLLVYCLYATQCGEALCKVAWIKKWFCPPTGKDLKSVCVCVRVQGERVKHGAISWCFSSCCSKGACSVSAQCRENVHSMTPTFHVMHNKMFKWHTSAIELWMNCLIFSVERHIVQDNATDWSTARRRN